MIVGHRSSGGASPPSIPDRLLHLVLPLLQLTGQVITLVLQPMVIAGPAGSKIGLPDTLSIQGRLVQAMRRDIQSRRSYFLGDDPLFPEDRRGVAYRVFGESRDDPLDR